MSTKFLFTSELAETLLDKYCENYKEQFCRSYFYFAPREAYVKNSIYPAYITAVVLKTYKLDEKGADISEMIRSIFDLDGYTASRIVSLTRSCIDDMVEFKEGFKRSLRDLLSHFIGWYIDDEFSDLLCKNFAKAYLNKYLEARNMDDIRKRIMVWAKSDLDYMEFEDELAMEYHYSLEKEMIDT